jgi:two-component system, NtrC family, sensor kinase
MGDQAKTDDMLLALIPREIAALLAKRGLSLRVELRDEHGQSVAPQARDGLIEALGCAQHRLAHTERLAAVGSLAAGVVHEARNLLTGALGFSQLLLMKPHDPSVVKEMARMVEAETRRCVDILASFLKLSRSGVEAARLLDACDLVSPVERLVAQPLRDRDCTLAVALADDLPRVFGSCSELQRVLINLILNAADAVGAGGHILVTGHVAPDGGLELSVIDDGPGVPAVLAERIFEPFFSTKPAEHGTGLGLSLSRAVIEAHGGKLSLDRSAPAGATFVMYLPPARAATGPLKLEDA